MAEEEEGEQTKINIHTPAPPSERIWMDVYLDQDGRLAKHDWCLDTGIIKNQGLVGLCQNWVENPVKYLIKNSEVISNTSIL